MESLPLTTSPSKALRRCSSTGSIPTNESTGYDFSDPMEDKPKLRIRRLKTTKSTDSEQNPSVSTASEVKSPNQVPMCAALFVATALGTPAIAFTGLKLGMAAALGGGMMGFFTGRVFAENEYVKIRL